jgi:hypothetical protein
MLVIATFLFMNLPTLDRTPGNLLKASPLPNATMVNLWDATLTSHIHTFNEHNLNANAFGFRHQWVSKQSLGFSEQVWDQRY